MFHLEPTPNSLKVNNHTYSGQTGSARDFMFVKNLVCSRVNKKQADPFHYYIYRFIIVIIYF